MRRLTRLGPSLLAASLAASPALACSVANPPSNSLHKRIAGRTDLQRVSGTLRIESVTPVQGKERSLIHGTVTRANGRAYPVAYPYAAFWVYCAIYYLPQGEASGAFYLSRGKRDGRYELIDWSGQYIAGKALRPGAED